MLREELMVPLDLSGNVLARVLGVTPARINDVEMMRQPDR
jgi:plasmid maintenance system antidote protein VapI